MLSKRALIFCAVSLAAAFSVTPAVSSAQDAPVDVLPGTVASAVTFKVERDGRLTIDEQVTVPEGPPVHRTIPLRQPAGPDGDRAYTVTEQRVDGPGHVSEGDDELVVELRPGTSTLHYSILGAVANAGDTQDVRWLVSGGWDVPVDRIEVSALIPGPAKGINCFAGELGGRSQCAQAQIDHVGSVHAQHFGLEPGAEMDFSVQMPENTVPANEQLVRDRGFADAFALTSASGAGLAGIGLVLIAGFGVLWYTRGRDVNVSDGDVDPVEVLLRGSDGTVSFASPDGVLPGQVGTVIDEHVDVVDVTATVIDLAVRNYLWIEELPGEQADKDWRLVALNDPDDSLRPYEVAVYTMLLGSGENRRRDVLLSQLRGGELNLTAVRDELYDDVVDKNWFSRRPDSERNLFWWGGIGLAVAGVVLTVALALTTSLALLRVGVVLGGVALTFGARLMPARTSRGSALVAQVRGLRDYLRSARAESLPSADREMVFSRSLPYAVVLKETDRWLAEFAELDPAADGTPGLYWYGEYVAESGHVVPNLRRFGSRFPLLLLALDGVLGQAGRLRNLK